MQLARIGLRCFYMKASNATPRKLAEAIDNKIGAKALNALQVP